LEYAKNVGLAEVQSEYFVSTDNDILCPLLDPDWLAQEIALLDAHPEYAAIALRPQVFVGGLPGIPFEKVEGDIKECAHVGGVLRIMRTQVVRDVGGWGNAPGRGHEELVICGKLRSAGFQVGYAKNLHAWHCFGTADAPWGYEDVPLESHGHSAVQPPVWVYDTDEYRAKFDPLTFAPKE
jgi:GT2 family glycosyltransferase